MNQCCAVLQVLLDKHALEKERQTLDSENQKLRALLKQYLDGQLATCLACVPLMVHCVSHPLSAGISVSDEVLSHTNPLLVVSSKNHPAIAP